jgi:cobalt transporter subunit CbtB
MLGQSSIAVPVAAPLSSRIAASAPALFAAALGLFMLWGVGFSHIDAIHNAAHDVRHSISFPCH